MHRDPVADGIMLIISNSGLRNKYVAEKAGYTPQQFCDMLHGRKTIKATDVVPIARALGVTVQEIYDAGADFIPREAV